MKIKENNVLSVIVDDKFIVEYDHSIPFALNIYHNNEEAKIHLKTAPIDFEIHDVEVGRETGSNIGYSSNRTLKNGMSNEKRGLFAPSVYSVLNRPRVQHGIRIRKDLINHVIR